MNSFIFDYESDYTYQKDLEQLDAMSDYDESQRRYHLKPLNEMTYKNVGNNSYRNIINKEIEKDFKKYKNSENSSLCLQLREPIFKAYEKADDILNIIENIIGTKSIALMIEDYSYDEVDFNQIDEGINLYHQGLLTEEFFGYYGYNIYQ